MKQNKKAEEFNSVEIAFWLVLTTLIIGIILIIGYKLNWLWFQ